MLFTEHWAHFHARSCLFYMCSSLNTRHQLEKPDTSRARGLGACTQQEPQQLQRCARASSQHTLPAWRTLWTPHLINRDTARVTFQLLRQQPRFEQSISVKEKRKVNMRQREKHHHFLKNAKSYGVTCEAFQEQLRFQSQSVLALAQASGRRQIIVIPVQGKTISSSLSVRHLSTSGLISNSSEHQGSQMNGSCDCSPLLTIRWLVVKCLHLQKKTAGSQASFSVQVQAGVFECRQQPQRLPCKVLQPPAKNTKKPCTDNAPVCNLQLYLPKYFKGLTSAVGTGTQGMCAFLLWGPTGSQHQAALQGMGMLLTEGHLLCRMEKKLKISLNKFF